MLDRASKGAHAYMQLAAELLAKHEETLLPRLPGEVGRE
jgi:hypothetical protein